MKSKLQLLLLAALLGVNICSAPSYAITPIPKGLGICFHFTGAPAKDLDMMKAAGFTIARTDLKWSDIERTKGQYDWTAYDQLVNGLISRGIRPYFILDYNNRNYGAANEMYGISTQEQINGYTNFAKAAVARYQGKGIIWEIWNEPNMDMFWGPTANATAYMNLVKTVVPAIKATDPNSIVVAPAVAFIGNTFGFVEACAQQGLFGLVDGLSVHPYKDAAPESGTVDYLYDTLRNMLAKYNAPNLPIIGGEFGFSTVWSSVKNETTQAQYVTRQILYHDYKKIPVSMVYDFKNDGTDPNNTEHNFGTIRADYSLKPAYTAIQTLANNLAGLTYSGRLASASTDYIYEYKNPSSGAKTAAAWTISTAHTVSIYGQSVNLTNFPTYVKDATNVSLVVPTAPSNVSVTVAKGATTGHYYANLSWTDNSTNETGFQIQQSVNSTSNFQTVATTASNTNTVSVDLGATPTQGTYYYTVLAANAVGTSRPSNVATATVTIAPTVNVPADPTNLKLLGKSIGATSGNYFVTINWADNATNETGYQVQQSLNSTSNFQTVSTLATNTTTTSVNLGKTPASGTYYYRVLAVNASGASQPSNAINTTINNTTATVTTPPTTVAVPAAPTSLKLLGKSIGATSGNYFVTINWVDNATNETSYQIQQSLNSADNFQTVATLAANSTTTSVNLGKTPVAGTYYYRVVAVNTTGTSQPSNVISTPVQL